ncbi:putative DNA-(apurinic or apyrimidinic site) lyase [Helianthus annuus]|uniref:DNA-(apurinic or apyrimidinic site) lyase n=1 Tax=Helianthus annuus TaxID=4232 RepID=A0A9K3NN11_HELAN|nr:putative DNA-(apurinic or apyrimidinic site) lyase [Helianthus annuus]
MKRHRPLPSPPSLTTVTPTPHHPKPTITSYYTSKKPRKPPFCHTPLKPLIGFRFLIRGVGFYQFPDLDRLAKVSEEELRKAGFGYRAKYIRGTVEVLQSKPGGGVEWLTSLRKLDLESAIEALTSLPGVGPKVAACIALFSLDQHHAVPVDTHVWKIATRYLVPELAGKRLTPKLCTHVADAFVQKYGKYAGWAQTLLFIAELPSQKALLQSLSNGTAKDVKPPKIKEEEES